MNGLVPLWLGLYVFDMLGYTWVVITTKYISQARRELSFEYYDTAPGFPKTPGLILFMSL